MIVIMKFCVLGCTEETGRDSQQSISVHLLSRGLSLTLLVTEPQVLTCYPCICANPCICGSVPILWSLQRAFVAAQ